MTKYDSAFAFCEVPAQRTRIVMFDAFGNVMNKCNNEDFEEISTDDGYVCIHMYVIDILWFTLGIRFQVCLIVVIF